MSTYNLNPTDRTFVYPIRADDHTSLRMVLKTSATDRRANLLATRPIRAVQEGVARSDGTNEGSTSRIIAWVDGGCAGNNSKTAVRNGWGSYLIKYVDGDEIRRTFDLPNARTSNEAEYGALILLLSSVTLPPLSEIRMDSRLVVGHLTEGWKVRASNLRYLALQAKQLLEKWRVNLVWVGRDEILQRLSH